MKMSVREARANFAAAVEAAEKGERVTITRNGKPVAEIGPATTESEPGEDFWARLARVRSEMGFDKRELDSRLGDEWLEKFNDPVWTRELFGPEYFDDEPDPA